MQKLANLSAFMQKNGTKIPMEKKIRETLVFSWTSKTALWLVLGEIMWRKQTEKCYFYVSFKADSFALKDLFYKNVILPIQDWVAEWLRRWTANPMGSARVSSNLIPVG